MTTTTACDTATGNPLKTRIRSAFIFGVIVLDALYLGGIYFAVLMGVAAGLGIYEWGKMVITDKKHGVLLMLFGICYIGFSVGMMVWIRTYTLYGLYNMLTLLLIVWASDVSAYLAGSAIGGPKLAPSISPKKTWAGFFGSSIGAGIVAGGLACPALLVKFNIETLGHMSPLKYAGMGFILAMFGQVGDLFISIFKRRQGIKDTGTLIPGHGGILDRIDALLVVALVFGVVVMNFR